MLLLFVHTIAEEHVWYMSHSMLAEMYRKNGTFPPADRGMPKENAKIVGCNNIVQAGKCSLDSKYASSLFKDHEKHGWSMKGYLLPSLKPHFAKRSSISF